MIDADDSLLYRIAFCSLKGMTYRFASDLLGRIGDPELFFTLPLSQLKSLLGFDNSILDSDYRAKVLDKARREIQFISSNNVEVIDFTDRERYPARLRECDDAPPMLFALGRCDLNPRHVVSVVGTRHATLYGIGFVKELLADIGKRLPDTLIVSGLAYGIDVAAHKASLENGVPTVGVLAHGLSTIYPAPHRRVAAEMVKSGGMLLTDYFHDARINAGNFLARNRIVAGMADCTMVVESADKGGAIVTAGIASSYNRDVAAIPGRVGDKYSAGCNRLIAENRASLVRGPDDLLALMGWEPSEGAHKDPRLFYEPTPEERTVMDVLERTPDIHINSLSVKSGIPVHRLMAILIDMEFKRLVVNQPGGLYRLA